MGINTIAISGRLTGAPELRHTGKGTAVACDLLIFVVNRTPLYRHQAKLRRCQKRHPAGLFAQVGSALLGKYRTACTQIAPEIIQHPWQTIIYRLSAAIQISHHSAVGTILQIRRHQCTNILPIPFVPWDRPFCPRTGADTCGQTYHRPCCVNV